MADDATRAIEGGPAQPVFITNTALPGSAPTGTQNVKLVNGAGTETGTAANPIRNDPTGTTIQPISGFVTGAVTSSLYAQGVEIIVPQDAKTVISSLAVAPQLYNGATTDMQRTPTVFKTTTTAASANTAVWTPAVGKKFRLMGYIIQVTAFAASATPAIEITFQDAAAVILGVGTSLSVPVASATAGGVLLNTGQIQLGNGILSVAANNTLNINLNAALTAGLVRVTVWGTEE